MEDDRKILQSKYLNIHGFYKNVYNLHEDDTSWMASGNDPAETVQQLERVLVEISLWARKGKFFQMQNKIKM